MIWVLCGIGIWCLVGSFLWSIHYSINSHLPMADEKSTCGLRDAYGVCTLGEFASLTIICALAFPIIQLLYIPQGISWLFHSFGRFYSSLKGVFTMKRWLLSRSLFLVLGMFTPDLFTKAKDLYTDWCTAPPSTGAISLVKSLESNAGGWFTTHRDGSNLPVIKRGEVVVDPGYLYADVYVNGSKCNGQFSYQDLRLINKAASYCVRSLTARAMDSSVKEKSSLMWGGYETHHGN